MNDPRGTVAILVWAWPVARPGRRGPENQVSLLLLMLVCLLSGCTTLRPIEVDAVTLHQKIRGGEAVKAGDTIRAITNDGVAHLLTVTAVDANVLKGHPPGAGTDVAVTELPIDDIVLVEVRKLSGENAQTFAKGAGTGALAVVVVVLLGVLVAVLIV